MHTTDPTLYDRSLPIKCEGEATYYKKFELERAVVLLKHPSRPDPDQLMSHWRYSARSLKNRGFYPKSASEAK